MNNSVYAYESCENKIEWCNNYLSKEIEFCEILNKMNIKSMINPDKKLNKYAPDIIVNNNIADLKYRATPFYSSNHYYNIDPQYAITFNVKDYTHYKEKYPDITIFFWIDFKETSRVYKNKKIEILKINKILYSHLDEFEKILIDSPIHSYLRRQNDTQGNAKDSFIFDFRRLNPIDKMVW
jgi:hypothetical protein